MFGAISNLGKVLLCALLSDNGRVIFLEKRDRELVKYSLPGVLADESENPVEKLKAAVLSLTGIDCMVGKIAFDGRHNAGSRRRKAWVPVLAFECSAKNYSCRVPCKWARLADVNALKLSREAEWLRHRQA